MNKKEIAEAYALCDSVMKGTGPLTPCVAVFPETSTLTGRLIDLIAELRVENNPVAERLESILLPE